MYSENLVTREVNRVDQIGCTGGPSATGYPLPSINADGSVVAFSTEQALVADDTNAHEDIYVWRRSSPCAIERVTHGPVACRVTATATGRT